MHEIAWMFADRRERSERPDNAYVMTALDGAHPGRRTTADDGGLTGSFASNNVSFSTRADDQTKRRIHSIGPISMTGTTLADFAQVLEGFSPVR
jgi:hypothetical protein